MTTSRLRRVALVVPVAGLLVVGAAGCGGDDGGSTTSAPPATAPIDASWDQARTDEARENARGYLGMNEADLPEDIRIARRGDEQFALTTDFVLGRVTVELDDTDGSGFRVVKVSVELPDGSESFELQPG